MPAAVDARPYDHAFFGHPRGLSTLFFTEMWERFSYYGMRALLILFMTAPIAAGGLGFETGVAGAVYGLYTSMVYMTSLPGGWIADRLIGQRRAVLYGGIIIACGHFSMAFPSLTTFYLGLALIVVGTGLLKGNAAVIVGALYGPQDARRDAGFSIYYMGINLGAFVAPLVCGYLGQRISWHIGFGAAGVGMVLGLVQYVAGAKYLGDAGLHPAPAASPAAASALKTRATLGGAAALVAIVAVSLGMYSGALPITAKQIADAAGIAEGTIFRVFDDKDAVIAAVIDAALDNEPLERALAAIDLTATFEDAVVAAIEIVQQRVVDVWRLVSSIGTRFHDHAQRPIADSDALVTLFEAYRSRLSVEPIVAARLLRAFTLSVTHPMLVGEPMSPPEIVKLFLYGVCAEKAPC